MSPAPQQFVVALLALLSAALPAAADTVVLKNGDVLQGRVVERGDRIYVETPLGGRTILREDVIRIESDRGAGDARIAEDVVVLKDSRYVRGDVRFSEDGSEVIVSQGSRGEVRHPRSAVASIVWRDGEEESPSAAPDNAAEAQLQARIDRLVGELDHETPALRRDAFRELLAIGPFARTYLEGKREAGAAGEALERLLADLDRLEEYRKVLPPRVEETVPRLAERLVSDDPADREAALSAVVMEAPDASGRLLLHAVAHDEGPGSERVKAYCISQLAALRRYEELAEVLKLTDGPLRLAAAFALGDAGIPAGVPILIDALRLRSDSPETYWDIKSAAIEKLREYTGQHFGFRLEASPEEQARAVGRWEDWWAENGADLVRRRIKEVAPFLSGGRVTEEETRRAKELWKEAQALLDSTGPAIELPKDPDAEGAPPDADLRRARRRVAEDAVRVLRQALDLDPGLSSARMTLAVLLYEELGRPQQAEQELSLIILRADHDEGSADSAKKFANLHLGRLAVRDEDWRTATMRFTQAINYDEAFLEAHEGQGDAYLGMALDARRDESLASEGRREALRSALQAYRNSLRAIDDYAEELRDIARQLVTESLEEGRVLLSVRKSSRALEARKASVLARIGRVHAALQQDDQALSAYRTASELAPDNAEYAEAVDIWSALVQTSDDEPGEGLADAPDDDEEPAPPR